jgi:uncharacterized membrane protein
MPRLLYKALLELRLLHNLSNALIGRRQTLFMLRKLSLLALFFVAITINVTPATFAQENNATVHGTFYDLWTFTPLGNVVIEVYSDSTLRMQTISTDGTYSLSLLPGDYTIMGKHYYGSLLVSDAQENVTLQPHNNITLDFIMFPTFDENALPENYDNTIYEEEAEVGTEWWPAIGVALTLALVGAVVAYYYSKILPKKKPAKLEKVEGSPPVKVVGLPDDLKEVMEVIRESGGRINQVELRQKLPYSEAKVSLMVADLENRGLVRKIKKGRGNIIVLTELEK